MIQLFTTAPCSRIGASGLKHRLFVPLRRGMLAALLLCTAWVAQAQNLTVKVNTTTKTGQASLQAAIEASNVQLADITSIEITKGTFTAEDWNYLNSIRYNINLESFTITKGITSVADMPDLSDWTSYFPRSLSSVSIDASFAIGAYAFYNCYKLTSISLPAATSIGSYAFEYCSALTTVSLPAATSIGHEAFQYCPALTTVSLPAATSIEYDAFYGCSVLTFFELGATPPPNDWI